MCEKITAKLKLTALFRRQYVCVLTKQLQYHVMSLASLAANFDALVASGKDLAACDKLLKELKVAPRCCPCLRSHGFYCFASLLNTALSLVRVVVVVRRDDFSLAQLKIANLDFVGVGVSTPAQQQEAVLARK